MARTMRVLGVDFTSAPSARKPISCAVASFDGHHLKLLELVYWRSFDEFAAALAEPGPWIAGMDFPFGQSRRFIENIGWPRHCDEYIRKVEALDRKEFRQALEAYKEDRPAGDKHHRRACDRLSRSQSPQTLYGTPVGLMFFEGAPRLLQSGVHLPFHHDGDRSPSRRKQTSKLFEFSATIVFGERLDVADCSSFPSCNMNDRSSL